LLWFWFFDSHLKTALKLQLIYIPLRENVLILLMVGVSVNLTENDID